MIEKNERESSQSGKQEDARSNAQRPAAKEIFEVRFKHFIQEGGPSVLGKDQLTASWPAWQKEWSKRREARVSDGKLSPAYEHRLTWLTTWHLVTSRQREDIPATETWTKARAVLGKMARPLDEGYFKVCRFAAAGAENDH